MPWSWALILFLSSVEAGNPDCSTLGHCGLCASTTNYGFNCRWCPDDNQCHAAMSAYNACPSSKNIVKLDQCPPVPTNPQTSFDGYEAVSMLGYSRAAYAKDADTQGCPAIIKEFVPSTFSCSGYAVQPLTMGGETINVLAYFGYDSGSNRIILAFRGSVGDQAVAEAIVTLTQSLSSYPYTSGVRVNPYFMAAQNKLCSAMGNDYSWLTPLIAKYPTAPVYVTGHSLGGALAALTAVELQMKKYVKTPPVLYTFGEPRTGDQKFANLLNSVLPRAFRVVNANDPVPHLPPCDTTCSGCSYGSKCNDDYNCCDTTLYYHHLTEIWFPEGEYSNGVMCGYKECLGAPGGEDASCSNRYVLANLMDLSAHSAYWNALNGFCKPSPAGAQPELPETVAPQTKVPYAWVAGGVGVMVVGVMVGILARQRTKASRPLLDVETEINFDRLPARD